MQRSQFISPAAGINGPAGGLTPREQEVLALLAEGHGSKNIASLLGLSIDSVRNHVQHLLAKFGAHSQLELVVKARNSGAI